MSYMEKNAFWGNIVKFLTSKPFLSGLGVSAAADQAMNDLDWFTGDFLDNPGGRNGLSTRLFLGATNGIIGSMLPGAKPLEKGGLLSSIPVKDLAMAGSMHSGELIDSYKRSSKAQADIAKALANQKGGSGMWGPTVAAILGLGGLGIAGTALWKYLQKKDPADTRAEITVPGTKNDPYSTIKVQVPMNAKDISDKLISGMTRGVKKKLRSNIKANSKKIDPITKKKIPYEEWVMKYGDEDDKEELGYDTDDNTTTKPVLNPYSDPNTGIQVKTAGQVPPQQNQQGPPKPPAVRCRKPVQPTTPPPAPQSNVAPGGNMKANFASSKIMSILARKNARQSGALLPNQIKSAGFYVDSLDLRDFTKSASAYDVSSLQEVNSIMDKIYKENPSYWPYGLHAAGHDSLYIIRDKMTKAAAGFVGWQEDHDKLGRKIGSYTIGILPEYRNNGFAKEAVAKVLSMKSGEVDEVRAYVVPGNKPSEGLANSLGVPVFNGF